MAAFGDKVRVRRTPETERLGLADAEGVVFGFTTPSITGVEVIGLAAADHATSICFDARGETLWLADDLLDFVDHNAGVEIVVAGQRRTRQADGNWSAPRLTRPWWRFCR